MENVKSEILSINDLTIGYSDRGLRENKVFSNINLNARKGELIVLIGRNGIGKSTLLRSIARLQESLSGDIAIFGKPYKAISRNQFAKWMSFVSTEIISVSNLKVFDLVSLGRFPYTNWFGKLNSEDIKLINEALELVGMENFAEKNVNEISDGERQRVLIARTLAQNTEIIVLDEPTAFLDLPNKYEIIHILNRLANKKKKLIILTTHDLNIAIQEADKIWLMDSELIVEGAPEDLILNKAFEKIFEESKLSFDINKGEIMVDKKSGNKICLTGEGNEYFWTKKALERMNYLVCSETVNCPLVTVEKVNEKLRWIYQKNDKKCTLNSIYDLFLRLKDQ